jgi:hypothetical protein
MIAENGCKGSKISGNANVVPLPETKKIHTFVSVNA